MTKWPDPPQEGVPYQNAEGISPRAVELFRKLKPMVAARDRGERDSWPSEVYSRFIDELGELDSELGRKPWEESLWHALSPTAPEWQRRQGPAAIADYADAHEVRMTLERL